MMKNHKDNLVEFLKICIAALFITGLSFVPELANHEAVFSVCAYYLSQPLLLVVTYLSVLLLMLVAWGITGRVILAYCLVSIPVICGSIGNYYKILLRDDPFVFADVKDISAGLSAGSSYDIQLTPYIIGVVVAWAVGCFCLMLLGRHKLQWKFRISVFLAGSILFCVNITTLCCNGSVYNRTVSANEHFNIYHPTESYVARGFVYPFLSSIDDAIQLPPKGYSEHEVADDLGKYTDDGIPEDKRINVLAYQLEAFSDFEAMGICGISEDVYAPYKAIREESYCGNLITNVFAGGTHDSERNFLIGGNDGSYNSDTSSYVWYFKEQGYSTIGGHPWNDWFYSRKITYPYFGFEQFVFLEDYYMPLVESIPQGYSFSDRIVIPDSVEQYRQALDGGNPVFAFYITYQGHGPYYSDHLGWGSEVWNPDLYYDDISDETYYYVNNYLGGIKNTGEHLYAMIEELREDEEPVVVVLYGDHKPWLGSGNSAYQELDINFDLTTSEGILNYYGTEYVIWANDAAEKIIGRDIAGTAPTISVNFLMNELFSVLGWNGDEYMQLVNDIRDDIPVISKNEIYMEDGEITFGLSEENRELYNQFICARYYRSKHFCYE